MKHQNRSWLVAGGAAVGLVVVGAAALRRLRREEQNVRSDGLPTGDVESRARDWSKARVPFDAGAPESTGSSRTLAESNDSELPRPLKQAINASRRVQGLPPPIPGVILDAFSSSASAQRSVPVEARHEVSALAPPRAIAPDARAAGAELADAGAIELPMGQSADPDVDGPQSTEGFSQSTGAALLRMDSGDGVHEEPIPLTNKRAPDPQYSAMPMGDSVRSDDAYDAIAPDDLGAEWLSRATEASPGLDGRREPEPPELLLESGMAVVSEGSLNAARSEEIESTATAGLGDLDPELTIDEDLPSGPDDENEDWIGHSRSGVKRR